jgi:Domain of unknown function (DUF4390)
MTSMTDSFMRCCKKLLSELLCGVLLAWLFAATAYAAGITVNKAAVRASDDGYHLTANYDINLALVMEQALSRGITLHFVGEFALTRSRWYWLDEDVFHSEQTIKLSYNVLTRQYRISRGTLFQNFTTFEDALNTLSRQSSPVLPVGLIKKDDGYLPEWIYPSEWIKSDANYFAAARLRLDTAQLPKLLQVNALTDSDWTLSSDWYRWIVTPAELSAASKPE